MKIKLKKDQNKQTNKQQNKTKMKSKQIIKNKNEEFITKAHNKLKQKLKI